MKRANDIVFSADCTQILFIWYLQEIPITGDTLKQEHATKTNIERQKTEKDTTNKKVLSIEKIEKFG